jgi:two-component system nitrogen regulation response regulator GlnG
MAPRTQAKILRLLQEGVFDRIGGSEPISADVRIIAATNQNLDALIEQGKFRNDLYYRLRGVTIHLPPLRERREDIAELAHYLLFRFNKQLGTAVQSISAEALELLEEYEWPGNVREFQSVIREALIASAGPTILPDFLPAELHKSEAAETEIGSESSPMVDVDWETLREFVEAAPAKGEKDVYRRALEQFDRWIVSYIMQHAGGQQNRAAEILGLSRVTLRSKLRHMHVSVKKTLARTETEDQET